LLSIWYIRVARCKKLATLAVLQTGNTTLRDADGNPHFTFRLLQKRLRVFTLPSNINIMNFQTMNKQRKYILIAAAAGALGMLLPWVSFGPYGSSNGMHGWGILLFLLFIAAAAVCLLGNQTLPLDKTYWFTALAAGGINSIVMVITLLRALSAISLFSIGFYLTVLASIALLYFAWQYRRPGDDIKSGFDSLKGDINKKVNSGTTSTTNM
jgi:hypothetical protein